MLKNYFKIAFRNLFRNKTYSIINIFGLAIGISCFVLIFLFIQDELSFDKFHKNHENIYRVIETRTNPDGSKSVIPLTTGALGNKISESIPSIKNYVNIVGRSSTGRFTIQYKDREKFYSGNHIFTSSKFFEIFNFELVAGNEKTCLKEPNTVVVTESAAKKYFGMENPVGEILKNESVEDCKVTGVMKDIPENSHLNFEMIFSPGTIMKYDGWRDWFYSWDSDWITTYILVNPEADIKIVEEQIVEIASENFEASEIESRKISLQALDDVHFNSAGMEFDYLNKTGDINYIYILSAIAFFILFIACINFMNLATARSLKRKKEVGLRKVLGAFRSNIIRQFLGESLLLTFISLLLAALFIKLLLPYFNSTTGKELTFNFLGNWYYILLLILLTFIVGIISGSYPAFFLSKFQPVSVMKGIVGKNYKSSSFSKLLVTIQFVLSIIMIISTIIVYQQIEFIKNKNLGFNKDHTIVVDINSGETRHQFRAIKTEMLKLPDVNSVTVSSRVPGDWKNIIQVDAIAEGHGDKHSKLFFIAADKNFLESYGIKLLMGRNFNNSPGDSTSILINQAALKMFGWNEPIGKTIKIPDEKFNARVIGVVNDFNFKSLYEKVSPMIIANWNNPVDAIDYYSIKVNSAGIKSTLSSLKTIHEKFDKVTPFEYNFLDDRINDFYTKDLRMGKLFLIAAIISIIIACLGLFSLSSYMLETRVKEIGIRKVLGASIFSIFSMLSKDFIKLIIIACIVSFPLAYLLMQNWLQDFAYRIDISFFTFILSTLLALIIAIVTISYQGIKAALVNPVDSIKYE